MRTSRAVLYGAQVFLSFFLMLVFMTYNVSILASFMFQPTLLTCQPCRPILSSPQSSARHLVIISSTLTWISRVFWSEDQRVDEEWLAINAFPFLCSLSMSSTNFVTHLPSLGHILYYIPCLGDLFIPASRMELGSTPRGRKTCTITTDTTAERGHQISLAT